jgi:hypothetical protein
MQEKTRKRMPRKKKERERIKPVLASELGLVCRQYEQNTTKACGRPAEFWIPGLGDACGLHLYGKGAIRYASTEGRNGRQMVEADSLLLVVIP